MAFVVHVSVLVSGGEGLLFVREGKEKNYGKLNLPGGHLDEGERLVDGAQREACEETGLHVQVEGLVGLYTGLGDPHYLHFVFAGCATGGELKAQRGEILECLWLEADEALAREDVLNPNKLAMVLRDYRRGEYMPLSLIGEDVRG